MSRESVDFSEAYAPGSRVRVIQQIPMGNRAKTTTVVGTVVRFGQEKTGSWYAHAKDDKLWLDRLELRKDDGERVILNLDQYSRIELLSPPAGGSDAA
jgi:hypothetical protein